jgi:hypothetical protein
MSSVAASLARERWTAIACFLSIALLLVAFIVGSAPEADASDATILDYYRDGGNQAKQIVAVLLTLGVFAFVVFVVGLRVRLVEAGAAVPWPDLVFAGGLAFVVTALVGFAVGMAVPATFVFSDGFELDPDTARVVSPPETSGWSASRARSARYSSRRPRSALAASMCSPLGCSFRVGGAAGESRPGQRTGSERAAIAM